MNLAEVKSTTLPIKRNTAYKWHSMKKHPRLLLKVGGKLFFDWDEWKAMAEAVKNKSVTHRGTV